MGLIGLIIVLAIVGVLWWLVETYIPMPPPMKMIIRVVIIVVVVLWLLRVFGVLGGGDIPIPQMR